MAGFNVITEGDDPAGSLGLGGTEVAEERKRL
jgi:hypothetical protein